MSLLRQLLAELNQLDALAGPESLRATVQAAEKLECNTVKRMPYVVDELETLDRQVCGIQELVQQLEVRLAGVLRNEPRAASEDNETSRIVPAVPVAERLAQLSARAMTSIHGLLSILNRLEV